MSSVTPDPKTPISTRTHSIYQRLMTDLDHAREFQVESVIESQTTIAKFERTHGMSSSEMLRRLSRGEIDETFDICLWSHEIVLLDSLLESNA